MTVKTSILIACIQFACMMVFIDGAIVCLGHILGISYLFTFPGGVGMAQSTSVCLMVLALCIIMLSGIVNNRIRKSV